MIVANHTMSIATTTGSSNYTPECPSAYISVPEEISFPGVHLVAVGPFLCQAAIYVRFVQVFLDPMPLELDCLLC